MRALGQSRGHSVRDGGLYTSRMSSLNPNFRGPEEDTPEAPPCSPILGAGVCRPVGATDRWHRPRPVWASQRGEGREGRSGSGSGLWPEQRGPHRAPPGRLPTVHHWGAGLTRLAPPSAVTLWLEERWLFLGGRRQGLGEHGWSVWCPRHPLPRPRAPGPLL